MMSSLQFSLSNAPCGDRSAYRSVVARECFDGEVAIANDQKNPIFRLERGARFPANMLSLHATIDSSMWRGWKHIRESRQHVYAIWLLRSGRLRMTHAAGTYVAQEGSIAIMDSGIPFRSEALVNDHSLHSSIFAVVPAYLFRSHVPVFPGMIGMPLATSGADGRIMRDVMALLYDEGDSLDIASASDILNIALKALSRLVKAQFVDEPKRRSIREERLGRIEAYVDTHLADPDLSATRVATALGITPRYLSYLLRGREVGFVRWVHRKRQAVARSLLLSPEAGEFSIGKIAAMTGYKSVAQFGRAFREIHGCSPTGMRRGLGN